MFGLTRERLLFELDRAQSKRYSVGDSGRQLHMIEEEIMAQRFFIRQVPFTCISLLVLCLILILPFAALSQQLPKVPFPYGPMGLNSMPWIVAKESNLFAKNGLDVDTIFVGVSTVMVQSMLSGSANIGGLGGPAVISNVLRGGDIIQVAATVPYFTQSLMVHPQITEIGGLRGKKVGITRFGAVTDLALRALLERNNIKDVTILQMGGLAETMAGLSKGSVDGSMVSPPHNFTLLKQGFRELVSPKDLRKLGIGFLTNGVAARRSYATGNREVIVRMIKATAEGTKLMTTNETLTKKLISKYLHIDDPELLHQSYLYVVENFAREPYVPAGAMQWMAQQLAQMNLVDAKALQNTPSSAFFDNSYVEEVKQSGFFESLWR
jgi:NitT/TauT family transport system substrate-binding protein